MGTLGMAGLAISASAQEALLVDVSEAREVVFEHRYFPSGEKHMPENMGAGVAIFDYDGDGALDLYFVQGAPVPVAGTEEAANRLLRQRTDGRFEDATARAGVGDRGLGMGVAVGDYDGDGAVDLYVTNYGPNVLYRNRGDGSFEDATLAAGVAGTAWSTGAVFLDIDSDGDLDLYVAAYLDYAATDNRFCGNAQTGLRAYCHPDLYGGATDSLYLNHGAGRFEELPASRGPIAGDEARGLGVATLDFDGSGTVSLYVANDTTANHLYRWTPAGALREQALAAGVAVNGSGRAEASMGVAVGDFDGDGRWELFLTHLDEETNTLYRPSASGLFVDVTERAGLAAPSRPWVGFGTAALDIELDGDLDLLVANGHIIDNIAAFDPRLSHRQPLQLFRNQGTGRFVETRVGLGTREPLVGRGLAVGDLDRDGDQDVVITQNGARALLLDNRAAVSARALVVTVATPRAADWRSRWQLTTGGRQQVRWFDRSPSYLSQSAAEIVFAVPGEVADLLRVPASGRRQRFLGLSAGRYYRFRPR